MRTWMKEWAAALACGVLAACGSNPQSQQSSDGTGGGAGGATTSSSGAGGGGAGGGAACIDVVINGPTCSDLEQVGETVIPTYGDVEPTMTGGDLEDGIYVLKAIVRYGTAGPPVQAHTLRISNCATQYEKSGDFGPHHGVTAGELELHGKDFYPVRKCACTNGSCMMEEPPPEDLQFTATGAKLQIKSWSVLDKPEYGKAVFYYDRL